MTQDEERYFEAYFDLFSSQGWKQFIEDMDGLDDTINDLASINDADNFFLRKGQLQIVRRILGFESAIKNAYQDNKENEQ